MGKRSSWITVGLVMLLVLIVAGIGFTLKKNDNNAATTTTSASISSTSTVSTTSSNSTQPSTSSTFAVVDTTSAIWPYASSTFRISDPKEVARRFAAEFVGFTSPVVGEFRQGDSRSGEIDVRPLSNGPVTTVLVRQLGRDNSWWVIGATTHNISITEPSALAKITSPVTLRGKSTAFEAQIATEVRQDGSTQPLGKGYVMGGSNGEIGPFDGTLQFTQPTTKHGAVMLYTKSAQNGQVWEVAVVRVAF